MGPNEIALQWQRPLLVLRESGSPPGKTTSPAFEFSAFFWLAALSFVVPAQAAPLDISSSHSWLIERAAD